MADAETHMRDANRSAQRNAYINQELAKKLVTEDIRRSGMSDVEYIAKVRAQAIEAKRKLGSPSVNPKSKRRPLCRCCESEPGILADPHCGPVCSICYAELTATHAMLEKIGPLVGIGACSSEVKH
jgi:hypothetical protein